MVGDLVDFFGARMAARVLLSNDDPTQIVRKNRRLRVSAEELFQLRRRYPARPGLDDVEAVISFLSRRSFQVLTPEHPHWPGALNDLGPHRPVVLYARGTLEVVSTPSTLTAVVGTRKPSISGAHAARVIGDELALAGQVIVSGGALGIDAIVHRCAIRNDTPTVLVAATGCDRVYPREHHSLFEKVAEQGVVLSETPPGREISPKSFLARNRIIAALASHTIVVECPVRSGALSTASHAATLGRVLSAVRYSLTTEDNEGNERLFEEWGAEQILLGTPRFVSESPNQISRTPVAV